MRVRAGKLRPPAPPSPLVQRSRLHPLTADVATRRLVVVTAGPGAGKTTLAAGWAGAIRSAWYSTGPDDQQPDTLAAGLAAAMAGVLGPLDPSALPDTDVEPGPASSAPDRAAAVGAALADALDAVSDGAALLLVVDDVAGVCTQAGGSAVVLDTLVQHGPSELCVVVLSRSAPALRLGRLRAAGMVLDVGPDVLAFSADEVRDLLDDVAGAGESTGDVAALTGGWPALVRLAAEALRGTDAHDRRRVLHTLARPGSSVAQYLVEEVLHDAATPGHHLRRLAALGPFRAAAARDLGLADGLDELVGRGLVRRVRADVLAVPELVAGALASAETLAEPERAELLRRLAQWCADAGDPLAALEAAARGLDAHGVAALLEHPVFRGGPSTVASAASALTALTAAGLTGRTELALLEGQARQLLGDWDGALECYGVAAGTDRIPAALAWRMAQVHVYRRDLDAAADVAERADTEGADDADVARIESWAASTFWFRGDPQRAQDCATRSWAAAQRSGDPGAGAAAHIALASLAAARGDRAANAEHYRQALALAERAGETLLELRVRVNIGSAALEQGDFALAEAHSSRAVALSELAGYAGLRVLALVNRGLARLRLGRCEEALADHETAYGVAAALGPGMTAYPLTGIGDVHRTRGDVVLAKAAYAAAVVAAERPGDVQSLAPALAGLARLQVDDDAALALRTAKRAVDLAPGTVRASVLLSAAWIAHAATGSPGSYLVEAEDAAQATNDRWSLAEALELRAVLAAQPHRRRSYLEQARAIWAELRDPVALARVDLVLAESQGPGGRAAADAARRRLAQLGVRPAAATVAGLLQVIASDSPPVTILALGGLRVLRHGVPVQSGEWQSKKARDLLKLLVVRRGRAAPRESLMEALWPDEPPDRISSRLSVLLSTVRGVLDPEHAYPPEHFVSGDKAALTLDLSAVRVDVEDFLTSAAAGLRDLEQDPAAAVTTLAQAEAMFAGEVFEDDPYADWVAPLREEARATYVAVVRALGAAAADAGDTDLAVRYCLRLLERDPYDEEGHLSLVRALDLADRHGEARRRHRVYVERMAELGFEAAPFPRATTGLVRRRAV